MTSPLQRAPEQESWQLSPSSELGKAVFTCTSETELFDYILLLGQANS